MAIDEKYLDNLLKSLTENEQQFTDIQEPVGDVEQSFNNSDNDDDWKGGLDDLIAQADAQVKEGADAANLRKKDASDSQDDMDADLKEIDGLLKNTGDEATEDDMLALLENFKDDDEKSVNSDSEEAFDIFTENASEENKNDVENKEDLSEEKPRKKKLFSKEKSKKRKKKNTNQTEEAGEADTEASVDGALAEEEDAQKQTLTKAGKKENFFSRVLTYLTQEEEELTGASDENAEILQELDKEDKQKAEKKEKKKKKADKKKEKADAQTSPEGEETEEGKKKKKKEKRKKEKPPKDIAVEKPVKVLSRKNLLVLIAACATLIASICVLSSFLPEYADKKNARQAFYDRNYKEAFRLLYDKNLNSSDSVIYNRVRTVLTIERKMESYENNLAMNRELEALDALMQGIDCYQNLTGVDEYGVREEVDAVYQQICTILQDNYDITPEEASEINAYDNDTYTRKLNSVISGTEFVMPGQELVNEKLPPQDVLPEEEEIISY